jgi:hypothetical protein
VFLWFALFAMRDLLALTRDVLSGKKTYLACGAIFVSLFGEWQGWWKLDPEWYAAMTAAGLAFLRMGVSKIQKTEGPQ